MDEKALRDPTYDLHKILDQVFDLPEHIHSLDLHMCVGQLPTLDITFYPDIKTDVTVDKRFTIETID